MIDVLTLYWSAPNCGLCLDGDERSCVTCKILCNHYMENALQSVIKAS
ncbi:hypothetical protein C4J89_3981 [Pseudomonas sp. R4-35-07]|nr:hypothetical protein C4J91_4110 [Pseudomonas sp. R3-52-08]AZF33438.1 hypothetical protein C4J89_3981 [Pseudomonas sp. R4-35-07]